MNKDLINVGIIGAGWITSNVYIPILTKMENVVIKAICDLNKDVLNSIKKEHGITYVYDSIEDFIKCDIDAALIAVPNYLHAEISTILLNNNINVFCEKPIALCEYDIRTMINIAKSKGLIFMPSFANRYREDVSKMLNLIKKSNIGTPIEIKAEWSRNRGVPRPGSWFTQKKYSGGGVLVDLGSHVLDVCLCICGCKQIKLCHLIKKQHDIDEIFLYANADWFGENLKNNKFDVEDEITSKIILENSTSIEMNLSWVSNCKYDYTNFFIKGSKGSIKLNTLFGFNKQPEYIQPFLEIENSVGKKRYFFNQETNNTYKAFSTILKKFFDLISLRKNDICINDDDLELAYNNVKIIEQLYNSCEE